MNTREKEMTQLSLKTIFCSHSQDPVMSTRTPYVITTPLENRALFQNTPTSEVLGGLRDN